MPSVEGLLSGLVMSLMLGTVFFAIIRNSIYYGYKSGLWIAFGVVLSDMVFISLAIWSTSMEQFLKNNQGVLSIVSGSLLIVLGLALVFKKIAANNFSIANSKELNNYQWFRWIINGFMLNVINPMNFFIWLGISAVLTGKFEYAMHQKIVYFLFSLLGIFIAEALLAIFASAIRNKISEKNLVWVNRLSGLVFIGIGIKLLFS